MAPNVSAAAMVGKRLGLLLVILLASLLAACAVMNTTATAPLPTDDVGPKPANPRQIAADWANAHYSFIPSHPFTADEMQVSEPKPVSLQMPIWFPIGRKVGWQVILGPENERLAQAVDEPYIRLIVYRDNVIFVEAQNYPFQ